MISYDDLDEQEKRLCDLLCEYDSLNYHVCPYIERLYVLEFGLEEYELGKLDLEIEKLQMKIESTKSGNISDIDEKFKEYFSVLDIQKDELNHFKNDDFDELTLDEFNRLNDDYKLIISNLHFNFHANQSLFERTLCIRAINAFKNQDIENLESIIEKISSNEISPLVKIKDFESIIDEFEESINVIKEDYPYNKVKYLFNDNEKEGLHSMMGELMSQRRDEIIDLEKEIEELTSQKQ